MLSRGDNVMSEMVILNVQILTLKYLKFLESILAVLILGMNFCKHPWICEVKEKED